MSLRVVVEPAAEPISLAEAKLHLRIDVGDVDQDGYIDPLIVVARQYAENYTRRALVTQTIELTLSGFPLSSVIELPRPPLQSVTWVKYIDSGGVLQTVAASDYQVDSFREPAQIKPAYLKWWEGSSRGDFNAVQVRYDAGYLGIGSPTPADYLTVAIPQSIKQWMKIRVAQMFEHREAIISGTIISPLARDFIDGLLDPYVVDLF